MIKIPKKILSKIRIYKLNISLNIDKIKIRKAVEETSFDKLQNLEESEGFKEVGGGKIF